MVFNTFLIDGTLKFSADETSSKSHSLPTFSYLPRRSCKIQIILIIIFHYFRRLEFFFKISHFLYMTDLMALKVGRYVKLLTQFNSTV